MLAAGLMDRQRKSRCLRAASVIGSLTWATPSSVHAHFLTQSYALPIPFSLYAGGASAALLLSFVLAIWMIRAKADELRRVARAEQPEASLRSGAWIGRSIALALLVVCIVCGLLGTRYPLENFNLTFFWIVFALAVPYLITLVGDVYARVNPWETLAIGTERLLGRSFSGPRPGSWATRLGHWPALVLYIAFISLELFVHPTPWGLSMTLLAYTTINLVGAWLFGRAEWFRHGELFAVMFRLLGAMSAIDRSGARARWRMPFVGGLSERPRDMGLVLFVLFMLSSTGFDGLQGSATWTNLYWSGINPALTEGLQVTPRERNEISAHLYRAWNWLMLATSPFVYLALFAGVAWCVKQCAPTALTVRELIERFTMSLMPIAFVYHVAHYFTLLLAQGGQVVRLASDPLGRGWNLFGTARVDLGPIMVDMGSLWHTQVGLIVAGHVASVWLAHIEAVRTFRSTREAARSQVPMLALMMCFTTFGLWLLSLPLAPSR